MNGNSTGIVPTIDLATNNGNGFAYPYPVMGGFGNSGFGGFGDSGALWLIVLLALIWNGNGNGNGFFGGNGGFDNGYAWLSNGQKDIMSQTSDGFNSLHLSNNIEGIRDSVNSLSNQLCSCCGDITSAINTTAYNAEIAAANRQMANMNTAFDLSRQFADCCCENRLGLANLTSTVISENCADREALSNGIRDIISNQTASTQRILDQLCNDKIDAKNEKIADLQREILMKDLQASQVAQTADIRANNAVVANQLVSELRSCPIPSQPVFGNQPIFNCQPTYGCGCSGNFTTSQFI